jgi:hypothetical protein
MPRTVAVAGGLRSARPERRVSTCRVGDAVSLTPTAWSVLSLDRFREDKLVTERNGIKRDMLDGRTSSTNRTSASNRSIKISASIATTFGSKRPKNDAVW